MSFVFFLTGLPSDGSHFSGMSGSNFANNCRGLLIIQRRWGEGGTVVYTTASAVFFLTLNLLISCLHGNEPLYFVEGYGAARVSLPCGVLSLNAIAVRLTLGLLLFYWLLQPICGF